MCESTSGPISTTEYEEALFPIAVRLDCAVRHWEKQLRKGNHLDATWMTECFGEELVREIYWLKIYHISNYVDQDNVAEVFDKQREEHPEWPSPHVHPIIALVGKEYKRSVAEESPMDPERMSTAESMSLCRKRRESNRDLSKQLSNMTLYKYLSSQEAVTWWLPGTPDPDDTDSEGDYSMSWAGALSHSTPLIHYSFYHTLADDDHLDENDDGTGPSDAEPAGVEELDAGEADDAEPSGEEAEIVPMDEDNPGSLTPPRRPQRKKRAMIISPSEKGKHPAKHAKYSDINVCTYSYSQFLADDIYYIGLLWPLSVEQRRSMCASGQAELYCMHELCGEEEAMRPSP